MTVNGKISIIVPVYEDSPLFQECIDSILKSVYPDFEVLVIDDSPAGIAWGDLPRAVRMTRTPGAVGPAAARNLGARESRGDILVFIDSDVVIKPDTLTSLVGVMERDRADSAIAILSPGIRSGNFCSVYKNIFLRYSFERLKERAPSFYTCCAMIKKSSFLRSGGFDEGYRRPAIEDTDMGHRLAAAGAKVVVGGDVEVEHVKRYTMPELVALDFRRAAALIRLFLRRRCLVPGSRSTSVPAGFIASGFLSLGMPVVCVLFALYPAPGYAVLFFALYSGVLLCNTGLLQAVRESCGAARAFQAAAFLPVEHIVSAAGSFWGAASFVFGMRY